MRALEIISDRCGHVGRKIVQEAVAIARDARGENLAPFERYTAERGGGGSSNGEGIYPAQPSGQSGHSDGAAWFSIRVADAYSRDDSRTIVRRAGTARVTAGAFGLLRAILTDAEEKRDPECDEGTSGDCLEELCREKV